MLLEGITNNQFSKLAKKIVKEHFPNLMGEDAYRKFYDIVNKCVNRTAYIEQCTNNVASNYFLPGCVRLCIEDTSYNPNKIEEILQFLTKYANYTAHGYVVTINRKDYRTTLEGIEKNAGFDSIQEKTDFYKLFSDADELIVQDNYIYCWYD